MVYNGVGSIDNSIGRPHINNKKKSASISFRIHLETFEQIYLISGWGGGNLFSSKTIPYAHRGRERERCCVHISTRYFSSMASPHSRPTGECKYLSDCSCMSACTSIYLSISLCACTFYVYVFVCLSKETEAVGWSLLNFNPPESKQFQMVGLNSSKSTILSHISKATA